MSGDDSAVKKIGNAVMSRGGLLGIPGHYLPFGGRQANKEATDYVSKMAKNFKK